MIFPKRKRIIFQALRPLWVSGKMTVTIYWTILSIARSKSWWKQSFQSQHPRSQVTPFLRFSLGNQEVTISEDLPTWKKMMMGQTLNEVIFVFGRKMWWTRGFWADTNFHAVACQLGFTIRTVSWWDCRMIDPEVLAGIMCRGRKQ